MSAVCFAAEAADTAAAALSRPLSVSVAAFLALMAAEAIALDAAA